MAFIKDVKLTSQSWHWRLEANDAPSASDGGARATADCTEVPVKKKYNYVVSEIDTTVSVQNPD